MKKSVIICIILLLSLTFCTQPLVKVPDKFNALCVADSCLIFDNNLDSALQLNSQRNLVYFLNASCSKCISDFAKFIKNNNDYRYDSLIVVASEAYDFIQVDYCLNQINLSLPKPTRIIFDPKNKIFVQMANIYGDKNIFLIEDKRILYKNNVGYFKYDEKYGYIIDQNQLKNENK